MDNTMRSDLIEELAPLHPFESDVQGGDRVCRICGLLQGGAVHIVTDGLGAPRGAMVAVSIEVVFISGLLTGFIVANLFHCG